MTLMNNMEAILASIYYNPANPAGFATADKLFSAAKPLIEGLTLQKVQKYLRSQLTFGLHQPARVHFPRNKIISTHAGADFQADLADMSKISARNDGFKYILVIVDVFSKFAYAYPLKTKSAKEMRKVFEVMFEFTRPETIFTDAGTEFLNRECQKIFTDNLITHKVSQNKDVKAACAERFIRTLKGKLYKYMTSTGQYRYIDVLQQIILAYNETKHSTTKFKPIHVDSLTEKQVFENIYKASNLGMFLSRKDSSKFIKGDKVRIKEKTNVFDKKFYPNWSDQIFTVHSVNKTPIPTYWLLDHHNKPFNKKFYAHEIQLVEEGIFRIERVLREENGRSLVRWLGYGEESDSWVETNTITNIQGS